MLDIGCGGGATLQRLLKRSEGSTVYGIDISEESVAKARKVNAEVLDKRVFITQGSAEKLPYEDGKFDLVTAVEAVYFWPNLTALAALSLVVIVPDEQGYAYKSQNEFKGYDKDILHSDNGFIS